MEKLGIKALVEPQMRPKALAYHCGDITSRAIRRREPRGSACSPSAAKLPFHLHELAAFAYQKKKLCTSVQPKDSYRSHFRN